jgi:hypothetical protein
MLFYTLLLLYLNHQRHHLMVLRQGDCKPHLHRHHLCWLCLKLLLYFQVIRILRYHRHLILQMQFLQLKILHHLHHQRMPQVNL